MEAHLKAREWFVGTHYSIADIALMPTRTWHTRAGSISRNILRFADGSAA